jgi:hypothetical protein
MRVLLVIQLFLSYFLPTSVVCIQHDPRESCRYGNEAWRVVCQTIVTLASAATLRRSGPCIASGQATSVSPFQPEFRQYVAQISADVSSSQIGFRWPRSGATRVIALRPDLPTTRRALDVFHHSQVLYHLRVADPQYLQVPYQAGLEVVCASVSLSMYFFIPLAARQTAHVSNTLDFINRETLLMCS